MITTFFQIYRSTFQNRRALRQRVQLQIGLVHIHRILSTRREPAVRIQRDALGIHVFQGCFGARYHVLGRLDSSVAVILTLCGIPLHEQRRMKREIMTYAAVSEAMVPVNVAH